MRALLIGLLAVFAATSATAQVYVHGYTTKNGTYVAPYYRSSPDSSVLNNWSTKGNINPYTGQAGTKNPYSAYGNSYGSYTSPYSSSSTPSTSCLYCSSNQTTTDSSEDDPQ
jgi:hypothetical protein